MTEERTAVREDYLDKVHRNKGMGMWRALYLRFCLHPRMEGFDSIIELGAGSPAFLTQVPCRRKVAVDVGEKYRTAFEKTGIEFQRYDLEQDPFDELGHFDVVVCSDVFEHLLWPEKAKDRIARILDEKGILFSHVPNEYTLEQTVRIMFGRTKGLYFHKDQEEWNDPHIRRFTDQGFRKFLEQSFQFNLKIADMKYRHPAKILAKARIPVPFCLQGGPTYISTNSAEQSRMLEGVKAALSR